MFVCCTSWWTACAFWCLYVGSIVFGNKVPLLGGNKVERRYANCSNHAALDFRMFTFPWFFYHLLPLQAWNLPSTTMFGSRRETHRSSQSLFISLADHFKPKKKDDSFRVSFARLAAAGALCGPRQHKNSSVLQKDSHARIAENNLRNNT